LLPPVIETFAFTEGDNMGCDPAGVAMAALAVAAAVIPDAVQLRMKPKSDGWKESARLWAMVVGNVSAKKTPVLNRTTRPIKKIDADMYRMYVTQLETYEDQLDEQKKSKTKRPKSAAATEAAAAACAAGGYDHRSSTRGFCSQS
jgi:hypothetical protein